MEYQGESSQCYCNYPEVQLANTYYDSSGYFVSSINFHVDVAGHNNTRYVASAATFDILWILWSRADVNCKFFGF